MTIFGFNSLMRLESPARAVVSSECLAVRNPLSDSFM